MIIQVGLRSEKNKSIQNKNNSINKFRDGNEHVVMDNSNVFGIERF